MSLPVYMVNSAFKMELYPILLMVSCVYYFANAIDSTEFRCSDDFCSEYETGSVCSLPDIEQCNNETLAALLPSPTVCSCCQSCFLYLKDGDTCIIGTPGQVLPTQMCGPGLKCVSRKCVQMNSTEEDPLRTDENYECEDGWCHCVAKTSTGVVQIFGDFPDNPEDKERKCECSVLAHKARTLATNAIPFDDIYQPFARCLPNGQFDPLQCVEGICSCVDIQTGVYDDTIRRVSISSLAPKSPLCFDENKYNHIQEYYRPCEKALMQLQIARDLAEAEGFRYLYPYKWQCRPDGQFDGPLTFDMIEALKILEKSVANKSFSSS